MRWLPMVVNQDFEFLVMAWVRIGRNASPVSGCFPFAREVFDDNNNIIIEYVVIEVILRFVNPNYSLLLRYVSIIIGSNFGFILYKLMNTTIPS